MSNVVLIAHFSPVTTTCSLVINVRALRGRGNGLVPRSNAPATRSAMKASRDGDGCWKRLNTAIPSSDPQVNSSASEKDYLEVHDAGMGFRYPHAVAVKFRYSSLENLLNHEVMLICSSQWAHTIPVSEDPSICKLHLVKRSAQGNRIGIFTLVSGFYKASLSYSCWFKLKLVSGPSCTAKNRTAGKKATIQQIIV
ncbi:hypothetical protein BDW67DRAFT_158402 [Aspergillus spinulosporus]